MQTIQVDLTNKKQVRDFLSLPFSIYRDIPQWVPPLQMDEKARLDLKRFPYYRHSQACFLLAYQRSDPADEGTRPVGRLAVLDNRRYNEFNHESTAFFYLFECEDNLSAATGLFEAGFAWARSHGLTRILGPKGFTPLDGFGLLVKGFEHRPAFGLPYNPAYYVPLIDEEVDGLFNQLVWLADPKLIKLVMKDGQAVGFLLAYPDVSAALQRTRGHLFPFGWLTLLRELRRTDWININGAGLLPEYRGSGGTAILYSELFKSIQENPRIRHAEVVQIGVENEAMQREMEHFGVDFYKAHRTYRREL